MTTTRKRRQQIALPTREEVARLLDVPNPRVIGGLRNRAILEIMYRAGLRVSEVVNLRVQDVRLDESMICIRHSKRDGSRNVPFGPRLHEWLSKWADRRPPTAEFFFCSVMQRTAGQQLTREAVWATVHGYAQRAGLEEDALRFKEAHPDEKVKVPWRFYPHVLRACFLTERMEDGFAIHEAAALAGHSSIKTTEYYLRIRPKELSDKMQVYG
jgi:integrase/recombinase XerD